MSATFDPPVGLTNTQTRFGGVAKTFHWLTALLILTMIPLGLLSQYWPYDTSAALSTKATLFSLHKTLGLVTFAVALARIVWGLTQPRPAMLPIESRTQAFAAALVHWALYGALVLVPLTGWIHHAATTGYAPIWWPFGQTLFFVPESLAVAEAFSGLHYVFNLVLVASLALHVAGALKHHFLDGDATLRRMLPGATPLPDLSSHRESHAAPALVAAALWLAATGAGLALGLSGDHEAAPQATLDTVPSQWVVEQGTLSISVAQMGQQVEGQFADWTAAIDFSEIPDADGQYGAVEIVIAIPSLSLGSVTEQALAADFLDAEGFATATFSGPITEAEDGYIVDGTLALVGQSQPLTLPFALTLEGDTATATGSTSLDRRSYEIGENYPDESSVGFTVGITFDLTATRSAEAG